MAIEETSVSEASGVYGSGLKTGWVNIREVAGSHVSIDIEGFHRNLTPDQARRLAQQLNRLAKRIDVKMALKGTK